MQINKKGLTWTMIFEKSLKTEETSRVWEGVIVTIDQEY